MLNLRVRGYLLLAAVVLAVVLVAGCSDNSGNSAAATKSKNVAKSVPKVSSNIPNDEPVARVAAQLGPSVVQVNVRGVQQTQFGAEQVQGLGSGVIYRKDGYIITNNHVVQGATNVSVSFADGKTMKGQVVGADPYTDIAVVKVDRNGLPAAKFTSDNKLLVGQLAVAIGSPSGFQSTVTAGVISGLNRELGAQLGGAGPQSPSLTGLIQTDAAISPGNSGGALADRQGEVVGINVAYLPQTQSGQPIEGIGFAIPSATATSVADQIIANGKAVHPYLGVRAGDLTPEIARQFNTKATSGAIIEVAQGGPAAQAGLKTGDVVTSLGSKKVQDSGDLISALRDYKPGDTVQVKVIRGGSKKTLDVKLGTSPQQQG